MSDQLKTPEKEILRSVAEETGVAIAVVNGDGVELSTFNNNSICRSLNPDGKLLAECSAFCGAALMEARELGGNTTYICHAGLECHAVERRLNNEPIVVIVGRTFTTAENYRTATERSISGNWSKLAAADLFDNVLLSSSEKIETALARLAASKSVLTDSQPESGRNEEGVANATEVESKEIQTIPVASDEETSDVDHIGDNRASIRRDVDPIALRSFFASILDKDYAVACQAFLELVAASFGVTSVAWFERKGEKLYSAAALGPLEHRKIVLTIMADDPRLKQAAKRERPLLVSEELSPELGAQSKMYIFPAPVGEDIPSALVLLDETVDGTILDQIARLCLGVGPQLEILRLRNEVSRKDRLAQSVRRFSEGLKSLDSDDFWLSLTQVASELMQAERGSILVLNDETNVLEIKAAVGFRGDITREIEPGGRVARTVLEHGKLAAVADVGTTGLPPFPAERAYRTKSFISSPISLGGRHMAVINFTDKATGGAFGRADLDLLEEITPQIAVAIDRAILKEKAGQFQQLSVTDALTGLLNRRYMDERLTEEVKRSNRHGFPMSFIMLDVDHFKSYNDQFGHPAGDEALKLVAQALRDTLRGADVAARYGGEEFAILLPQTNSEEAAVIAERIRANVQGVSFQHREVTISVGVATCRSEFCNSKELILAADRALYGAKNTGRNRVNIHSEVVAATIDPK